MTKKQGTQQVVRVRNEWTLDESLKPRMDVFQWIAQHRTELEKKSIELKTELNEMRRNFEIEQSNFQLKKLKFEEEKQQFTQIMQDFIKV